MRQQQAFRPVPQEIYSLWNRPESLFMKDLVRMVHNVDFNPRRTKRQPARYNYY
ncbi:hypothetical protein QUA11_29745 [Microcoleus sp. S13_D1]